VYFEFQINNASCSYPSGHIAAAAHAAWAVKAGVVLNAYIGAYCSDASRGVAYVSSEILALQISYASSSVEFSDKDKVKYRLYLCPC
jgi:hypothetical protein